MEQFIEDNYAKVREAQINRLKELKDNRDQSKVDSLLKELTLACKTKEGNLFLVERNLIVKDGFSKIKPSLLHNLKYDLSALIFLFIEIDSNPESFKKIIQDLRSEESSVFIFLLEKRRN